MSQQPSSGDPHDAVAAPKACISSGDHHDAVAVAAPKAHFSSGDPDDDAVAEAVAAPKARACPEDRNSWFIAYKSGASGDPAHMLALVAHAAKAKPALNARAQGALDARALASGRPTTAADNFLPPPLVPQPQPQSSASSSTSARMINLQQTPFWRFPAAASPSATDSPLSETKDSDAHVVLQ